MLARIIALSMTVTVASTTQANESPQNNCSEQLTACEQVVNAGQLYIDHLGKLIDQKSELAAALERQVELYKQRAIDAQPSWYERPSFVAPAAVVGTILVVILVKKAAQ